MNKTKWIATGLTAFLIPATAFAAHVNNCCGDWLCCLLGTGCC